MAMSEMSMSHLHTYMVCVFVACQAPIYFTFCILPLGWWENMQTLQVDSCHNLDPLNGSDFLHCWVTGSIWLERAESLITKQ